VSTKEISSEIRAGNTTAWPSGNTAIVKEEGTVAATRELET
jgi:hypothetical protein